MVFSQDTRLPYTFELNQNYVLELLNDMGWYEQEDDDKLDFNLNCYCLQIENDYLNYYCSKQYPHKFEEWFLVNYDNYEECDKLNMKRVEEETESEEEEELNTLEEALGENYCSHGRH
jgi:hypothetical protein